MATSQSPAAPSKVAVWEDFIDLFTSPSEVFARRSGAGTWLQVIVITVLATGLFIAVKGPLQPAFDAEFARASARAMAKNPQLTAAQMEAGRAIFEKFGIVLVGLFTPISFLFTGFALWLAGKLVSSVQTFSDAFMVATYAYIPRLVGLIVAGVIALMVDPAKLNSMFSASIGVGRFLDPDTTPHALFMLGGRVELFVIWQTVLLGIGLSVTGKVSRGQAFAAAAFVWLLGSAMTLLQG